MEPGHYQLQIFVSLVVILAAAFVALICDFLKGNNEQLRELVVELKVLWEEEQKRSQMLTARLHSAKGPTTTEKQIEAPAARTAIAKSAGAHLPAREETKRTLAPEALAAMERGAQMAGIKTLTGSPARMAKAQNVEAPQSAPAPAKKNWNALLRSRPVEAPGIVHHPGDEMNQDSATAQSAEATLPAGFQDSFVLSNLVQSRQPVSGLIVSIGVNAARRVDGSLPDSVRMLIQSLIGPSDFACQSGDEEFLLIYPQERGASAQRRLSQVAQQLWDYQLRSLGTFQILFSWGGVEVRSEHIDEAIASASERMQETKRGRKLIQMASPAMQPALRQAV